MERIILARLEWFLESNSIYPDTMTGFRQGRGSIDNVMNLTSHVEDHKLRGKLTTTVFLDVRGAFDNVSHSAVLQGLRSIGVKGRLYNWIANYLHNRTIFMHTNEGDTSQRFIKKGVPQGGVLSPVLFNISLIGITEVVSISIHITLYADDICLWTSAISLKCIPTRLLCALTSVSEFLTKRGLELSPEKSAALAFTRMKTDRYPLKINGTAIPYVSSHKFLGIFIDRGLTWNAQLAHIHVKLSSFVNLGRF